MKQLLKIISVCALFVICIGCSQSQTGSTSVNQKWQGRDGSLMTLSNDGTYYWYQSPDVLDDNYYYGDYRFYKGNEGIKVVSEEFPDLGITESEQMQIIQNRNEKVDHYYVLVQHRTLRMISGEKIDDDTNIVYIGMYDPDTKMWDAMNCMSANYALFTLLDEE